MFIPRIKRIEKLAEIFPETIKELEIIFSKKSNVYIDWSNVIHWQEKLGWHIHLKRLKQLLDSFDTIQSVKLYEGTLAGNNLSINSIQDSKNMGYDVRTKPVKLMQISIDTSSIPINSPSLLQSFIKKGLLSKFNLETIEFLNSKLTEFNKQGTLFIEEKKCNFDVEIGRDMLLDFDKNGVDNFILWSGDSDFVDPISQLKSDGKNVYLFATTGTVSSELNYIKVPIFEIKKIREFICWPKEIPLEIKKKIDN